MARSRFVRPGKTIDYKAWLSMPSVVLGLTGDGTSVGTALSFVGPGTILRSRGRIQASLNPSGKSVDDHVKIGLGLGIVSTDVFTVGGTSMPDPSGEPEYPWLWWDEFHLRAQSTTGIEVFGSSVKEIMLDTKAMRKVKPGQSLATVIQYVNITGTPIVNISLGQFRVLIGT